ATSYKGGTTWMQNICGALIFQSPEPPDSLDKISPWVDAVFEPNEDVMARIEEQTHRRYLKTHLPLSAIPYFSQVKYIYVGRDGRDVFMSMANHLANMKPEMVEALATRPDHKGPPLPPPAPDLETSFNDWVSKGTYEWEQDGYPIWSHHYHAQTWWEYRHLDNILHVHFQDLLDDLDGQMRRIAAYLDIPVNEEIWPNLVQSLTFGEMKKNASKRAPGAEKGIWKDTSNFFHKGTNRRWEGVLSDDQIRAFEKMTNEVMEPSLVQWLVHEDGFVDPKTI
ncbi:MAG: sulfotransferase domain-containing protein, partial [Gammaproteobacteria bacterium]